MNISVACANCRAELNARIGPSGILIEPCECKGDSDFSEIRSPDSFAHCPEQEEGAGPDAQGRTAMMQVSCGDCHRLRTLKGHSVELRELYLQVEGQTKRSRTFRG